MPRPLPDGGGVPVTDDGRLTLQQAADHLGVHYMTAYRYVRLGLLPAEKVGATWQLDPSDVERLRQGEAQGAGRRQRAPWAARLESRLLAGDEPGSWGVVEAALSGGARPDGFLLDVLAPAMRAIGDGWARGEVDVAVEHRASVIAARLVGRLGSRFNRRGRSKGTVVVGAVAGELHALPVAILADVLRGAGWSVVDLGADVPADSFARLVAGEERVVAVGVSVTTAANRSAVSAALTALRAATPAPLVLGGVAVGDEAEARRLGADRWAADGRGAVELLASFVPA